MEIKLCFFDDDNLKGKDEPYPEATHVRIEHSSLNGRAIFARIDFVEEAT